MVFVPDRIHITQMKRNLTNNPLKKSASILAFVSPVFESPALFRRVNGIVNHRIIFFAITGIKRLLNYFPNPIHHRGV